MKITKLIPLICTISISLLGCDKPERTVDSLREKIAAFRAAPDDQKFVDIEKNLAKLDAQILKLRTQGNVDNANLLQKQRDSLASDFGAAKVHRTLQDAKSALKGIQDVIQKTGESLRENSDPPSPPSPTSVEAPTPEVATPAPAATSEVSTIPQATPEVAIPGVSATPQASPTVTAKPIIQNFPSP